MNTSSPQQSSVLQQSSKYAGLISDLQGLAGPTRLMDALIDHVLFDWTSKDCGVSVPNFTSSIDAALSLVPQRWSARVSIDETRQHAIAVLGRSYPTNHVITQEARTIPIALCIAALKAQAVGDRTEGSTAQVAT